MEKLYRKKENGRYEPVGYGGIPDISDGIWLVKSEPGVRSVSSLVWRVGDLKRPVDVTTQAAILQMVDKVTKHLMKLGDTTTPEYEEVKKKLGGYLRGPVHFTNISPHDLADVILQKIAELVEESSKSSK